MPIKSFMCHTPDCGEVVKDTYVEQSDPYPTCTKCGNLMEWLPEVGMIMTRTADGTHMSGIADNRFKKPLQPFDGGKRVNDADVLGKI